MKFYNMTAGYGIVEFPDGPDALVHVSVLRESGTTMLKKNDPVLAETAETDDGRLRVTRIESVRVPTRLAQELGDRAFALMAATCEDARSDGELMLRAAQALSEKVRGDA